MAVGQQRQPAIAQAMAAAGGIGAEAGGRGEQLLDRVDPDDAGAAERRVVDPVAVEPQAARLAAGRQRAELAAGLEDDDRLHAGGGARGGHEAAGVGDAFEMHQDRARREVEGQIVEDVAQLDVGALAQGDDPREADPLARVAQSSIAVAIESDWVTKARSPSGGSGAAEPALSFIRGTITPTRSGPIDADAVPARRRAHRTGLPGVEGDRAGSAADHH